MQERADDEDGPGHNQNKVQALSIDSYTDGHNLVRGGNPRQNPVQMDNAYSTTVSHAKQDIKESTALRKIGVQ